MKNLFILLFLLIYGCSKPTELNNQSSMDLIQNEDALIIDSDKQLQEFPDVYSLTVKNNGSERKRIYITNQLNKILILN